MKNANIESVEDPEIVSVNASNCQTYSFWQEWLCETDERRDMAEIFANYLETMEPGDFLQMPGFNILIRARIGEDGDFELIFFDPEADKTALQVAGSAVGANAELYANIKSVCEERYPRFKEYSHACHMPKCPWSFIMPLPLATQSAEFQNCRKAGRLQYWVVVAQMVIVERHGRNEAAKAEQAK